MNTKDYTYLLNKPYSLNEKQTADLEKILSEFPFLQSARAIYLKGLYNQDSFRYNTELKKTAAYTTDRSVLFDFITSEQFQSVDKDVFEQLQQVVQTIDVNESEIIALEPEQEEEEIIITDEPEQLTPAERLEESIKRLVSAVESDTALSHETPVSVKSYEERLEDSLKLSISTVEDKETAEPVITEDTPKPEIVSQTEEKLEIGKPLEFNKDETHSFAEWLQLSRFAPINRNEEPQEQQNEPVLAENETETEEPLNKKMDLIDRFIETNPKIGPAKNLAPTPVNVERSTQDSSILMTETLARVYLEQKKYSKAIQAYEILILKYPEKSVFFADRISDIKIIQQNNNLKNDA